MNLASIPTLKDLSFCHPMASPNPVCCLCNYSTHLLYHLPHLRWLDGCEVGFPELQKLVRGLVQRKVQYYRMLLHHWIFSGQHRKQQLQHKLNTHLNTCYPKLKTISKNLKMVLKVLCIFKLLSLCIIVLFCMHSLNLHVAQCQERRRCTHCLCKRLSLKTTSESKHYTCVLP